MRSDCRSVFEKRFFAAVLITFATLAGCSKNETKEEPAKAEEPREPAKADVAEPPTSPKEIARDAQKELAPSPTEIAAQAGHDAGAHAPSRPEAAKDASASATATSEKSKSDAGAACGTKPLPDCPLQAWMKARANPPMIAGDLPALAKALDEMVRFGPLEYKHWASIAEDGAAAARNGDQAAAKASCRGCHDRYKQSYKTDMRARPL